MSAIVAGSDRDFGLWMVQCEPVVRRSLRSFAAVVDTEVVLQEALLRVWQVAPRIQPDGRPNSLLRYTIKTARNLAISEVRRTKRIRPALQEELDASEEAQVEAAPSDPFLRQRIEECKNELPENPRKALMARLESSGGENDHALAQKLSMRKNTFLQNITRARKFLLLCLQKFGVELEGIA